MSRVPRLAPVAIALVLLTFHEVTLGAQVVATVPVDLSVGSIYGGGKVVSISNSSVTIQGNSTGNSPLSDNETTYHLPVIPLPGRLNSIVPPPNKLDYGGEGLSADPSATNRTINILTYWQSPSDSTYRERIADAFKIPIDAVPLFNLPNRLSYQGVDLGAVNRKFTTYSVIGDQQPVIDWTLHFDFKWDRNDVPGYDRAAYGVTGYYDAYEQLQLPDVPSGTISRSILGPYYGYSPRLPLSFTVASADNFGEPPELTISNAYIVGTATPSRVVGYERFENLLFVARAVPEPSTYMLVSVGLGIIAVLAKRKKGAAMKG